MDVQKKLDEIVASVGSARSMPMSASCVVNRAELLAMLEEVRQALPGSLAQAEELIGGREQMVEHARRGRADHRDRARRARLTDLRHGGRPALPGRGRPHHHRGPPEAEEVRAEADDYVDSKLANFEVVLTKTLGSVGRGREKLLGTGPGVDDQGYEDEDAPERSHDPETLRRSADEYVDVKLGAFEAVLAKTLDAVGRGRQKLHGRIASDDLGLLTEDGTPVHHTNDNDYLAGLAGTEAPEQPAEPQAPEIPAQQQGYVQQDAYAYQQQAPDPYGYQQQYAQQDAYGYQQQTADPYAAYPQQQGYDQQPAYDQSQQQAYAQPQGHAQTRTRRRSTRPASSTRA